MDADDTAAAAATNADAGGSTIAFPECCSGKLKKNEYHIPRDKQANESAPMNLKFELA